MPAEKPVRLLILDRDGVINQDSAQFVKSADEWLPLPGSIDAIARLSKAGYTVAVATNQSGLARGLFGATDLEAMHEKLRALVAAEGGSVGEIAVCPHGPDDGCACRKPRPGLLQQLADFYDVDLKGVPFIGDASRDLEAALAAGAEPVLVRTGKGLKAERTLTEALTDIAIFDDLAAAADALIERV